MVGRSANTGSFGRFMAVDPMLARLREEYETDGLVRSGVDGDPVREFDRWMRDAVGAGVFQANAMILATADGRGRVSSRAVLLKGYDSRGFVFYTNLESRKAREIEANPWASLCIVWLDLHRQIRIEGTVGAVDERDSDEYFESRPRDAQIAAAASPQSRSVADRAALDRLVGREQAKHGDGPVPRPSHWGGLRVCPQRIEFWQGRRHRLHDRIVYEREGSGWRIERLAP